MATQILTQSLLQKVLRYEPDTGCFYWLAPCNRFSMVTPGQLAGTLHNRGYIVIKVYGRCYRAHRLAWLYVNGVWPNPEIDHINRNRTDNRIANLREVDHLGNMQNKGAYRNNTSGYTGVSWHKQHRKWCAQIQYNKRNRHIGLFDDPQVAHVAYLRVKEELSNANDHL